MMSLHAVTEDIPDDEILPDAIDPLALQKIRDAIERPNFQHHSGVDPLHDIWSDTDVIILAPVWDFFAKKQRAPTLAEIDRIMESHPARAARPGVTSPTMNCHPTAMRSIAMYCRKHGRLSGDASWIRLSEAIAVRHQLTDISEKVQGDLAFIAQITE